ncbi:hypothetical protein QR680_006800 [Steinernema hermaphroditum]|uniref:Uncharacterized protein n=1 Tax=Steinernema hermaphroditum TaxID=289476 RepID=A0AA39LXP2_9BILA|nr:hypothetical protein QR680_006800 [Steinernema hermaphroditum]
MEANGTDGGIQGKEQFARNFGLLYICIGFITIPISCFVLSVFCRPPLIKHSCYKLMSFNTVLDIINLSNAALIPGFLSVQNIHHCNSGMWVTYVMQEVCFSWHLYCCASEVLALNRMLEFANKNLAIFLFEGKRVYLWFGVCFAYAIAGALLPNIVHIVNNFFKFGFLTVTYVLMLFFMHLRLRRIKMASTSSLQIKVSIQALAIAGLADAATMGYVIITNVTFSPEVSQYIGVAAELIWIALHGGSIVIYSVMNNAVRSRFREAFCRSSTASSTCQVKTLSTSTR